MPGTNLRVTHAADAREADDARSSAARPSMRTARHPWTRDTQPLNGRPIRSWNP
jgi:hypothetical protein